MGTETMKTERQCLDSSLRALTLEKGLLVLDCYDVDHPAWTLKDLCAHTGIPRATAYRLIKTLEDLNYVTHETSTSQYHLGPRLIKSAYVLRSYSALVRVAQPRVDALRDETTETVVLAVWTDPDAVLLCIALTARPFKPAMHVGTTVPGPTSTHGKMALAFGPESRRTALLQGELQRHSDATALDPERLKEELDHVRREGVAYSVEEVDPGMCAVGAPVFNGQGQMVASIAVVVPVERFGPIEMRRHAEAVRRAAAAVSREEVLTEAL